MNSGGVPSAVVNHARLGVAARLGAVVYTLVDVSVLPWSSVAAYTEYAVRSSSR